MHISVVGLGKLGSPLAAVFASKGFTVIGADLNGDLVEAINGGRAPFDEPDLQSLIEANRSRLRATRDTAEAVAASEATFVIVPTPTDPSGRFDNTYLLKAMTAIGDGLRRKDGYHVVVITSTVMPGSTGGEIRQALERASGRVVGADLGLCYNPEFIALGSVVRNMLYPDMLLIGESDAKAGGVLEAIYRQSCSNTPVFQRMNFVNAELAKIAVNTYVTTKISYANMLADICDRLPDADVDAVTRAIGCDSRIGGKYLQGAIGYGGPCFPRDNVAFSTLARQLGARADLAEATDAMNQYQIERVLGAIEARLPGRGPIAILGLAYKPETPVIEESQGVRLAERLLEGGHEVIAFDPKAAAPQSLTRHAHFTAGASAEAAIQSATLVVVMTPWPAFRALSPDLFARPAAASPRLAVLDCWRVLPREVAAVADLVYLGQGAFQTTATFA